jgi:hypothetical protein
LHLHPHNYVSAQLDFDLPTMDGTAVLWPHVGTVPWTATVEWCHEMGGCTHWKGFEQEAP